MDRGAPGEELPALYDDIDISRVELDAVTDAAGHFGGDQACPGAKKRVVNRLAGPAVVGNRAAHAFDPLLGAAPPTLLALPATERIGYWRSPTASFVSGRPASGWSCCRARRTSSIRASNDNGRGSR